LEQFWHAFTSRGFDSVSWAFLSHFHLAKLAVCGLAILPGLQSGLGRHLSDDFEITFEAKYGATWHWQRL